MEVGVRWMGFGVLAVLAACSCNGDDKDRPGDSADGTEEISDLTLTELEIATAYQATWTTIESGTSFVEYGVVEDDEDDPVFDRVSIEGDGTDHSFKLLLLKSNTDYQARGVTVLADGTRLETPPVAFKTGPPPQDMGRLLPDRIDASRSDVATGYMLMTTLGAGPSFVGIVDGDGDWVWWSEMPAPTMSSARARLSRDGRSVLYWVYQTDKLVDDGWIIRKNLDGTEESRTKALNSHHDFVELPEGQGFAWIAYDQREIDTVDGEVPIDESADPPAPFDIGEAPYPVAADVLYEGPEGLEEGDTPTEVWSFWEDYGLEPYWVCENMFDEFLPGWFEWNHSNSLAYVDEEDSYYLGSRYLDAFLKISRDGTEQWQLGGILDDFTWRDGSEPFNHMHVSEVWDGGMLVFDNRDHADGPSRVAEIHWDDTPGVMEAWVEWEFPRPDGAKLLLLGDARHLPNGNVLIAWSARGEFAEVTKDTKDVVYRMSFDIGAIPTRVEYFTDADIVP